MAFKFKINERIIVIAGKNKGQTGVISSVLPNKNLVVVDGINVVIKHVKPNQSHPNGARIKISKPIDASNIMHVDPKAGIPTKIGYKFVDGSKVKYSKKSKEIIEI